MTATYSPAIITTEDGGREQRWSLPTDEATLLRDRIRTDFLGLGSDPLDRAGRGFRHQ